LAKNARASLGARELVILSTCNRFELYYVTGPEAADALAARALLAGAMGGRSAGSHIYHHQGETAVSHLFAVACGLDSMILGECEIMAQLKSALAQGPLPGPRLTRLFHHALHTGKRARRETEISSGVFSLGQCAARMAQGALGSLQGKRILVFGAGQAARVTIKHLVAQGAGPVAVYSRTRDRALALAETLGGQAIAAAAILSTLRASDILVGCASAPHRLLTAAQLAEALPDRAGRLLVVIDLGVPRNVDPAVGRLPGVRLFNVDDLEALVAGNAQAREAEIGRVRALISQEVARFRRHAQGTAASLITQLQAQAEQARQECLSMAMRRGLPQRDLAQMDYLTDLLVRKLLHRPITALREDLAQPGPAAPDLASAASRLFGLHLTEAPVAAAPPPPSASGTGK